MTDLASTGDVRHLGAIRVAGALQEIGILELTFAPLDFYFDPRAVETTIPVVASFILAGVLLFSLGVSLERRAKLAN